MEICVRPLSPLPHSQNERERKINQKKSKKKKSTPCQNRFHITNKQTNKNPWPRISPWTILIQPPEHPKEGVKQLHLNKRKEKEMQLYVNASWADGCNKSVFNSISTESSPVICKQALSVMSNHTLTLMTELLKALECIVLRHNIQITNITICVSHVKFPDQLSVSPKLEKSIILCLTFSVCHFFCL